jgi:hypothetical protein
MSSTKGSTKASKFNIGDCVEVIDAGGSSRAVLGEIVTVIGINESLGGSSNPENVPTISVRPASGPTYSMMEYRFDFPEGHQPNQKTLNAQDIKKMIDDTVVAVLAARRRDRESDPNTVYTLPVGSVLVLRTSKLIENSLTGSRSVVSFYKSSFVWPEKLGAEIVCDDYVPSTTCGNGLHGLLWGYGDHSYLSREENAVWQIVEVREEDLVDIRYGKVKFGRGRLVYSGDLFGASKMLEEHAPPIKENIDAVKAVTSLRRRMYNQDFSKQLPLSVDAYSNDDTVEVGLSAFSNLIGSQLCDSDLHAPALDIDVPHSLTPSSTPGHGHLFIDVPMPWKKYKKLLKVMGECGILEKGYVDASIRRRGSFLRLPWVKKMKSDRSSY